VFENRVQKGIFGLKRDEVIESWRKLHNEELHNVYSSPSTIIRIIKSKRMGWAGNVARMRRGIHIRFWCGSQKERDYHEDLDIGGRIILKWILEIGWGGMDWIDLTQDSDQRRALVNTVLNLRVP
jgi:hypothetical protein